MINSIGPVMVLTTCNSTKVVPTNITTNSDGGFKTTSIAPIIVGSVVGAILVIAVVVICYEVKKRKQSQQ